jgi:hypothetical protein
MPRSRDAKSWQPDASDQKYIDRMAGYLVVAERCGIKLRSLDQSVVEPLWNDLQVVFYNDPIKYPSAMPQINDVEGRRLFQEKCEAICFPPASSAPSSLEE